MAAVADKAVEQAAGSPRPFGLLTYALACWLSFACAVAAISHDMPADPASRAIYWLLFSSPFVVVSTVLHWRARRMPRHFIEALKPLLAGAAALGGIVAGGWYDGPATGHLFWLIWPATTVLACAVGTVVLALVRLLSRRGHG